MKIKYFILLVFIVFLSPGCGKRNENLIRIGAILPLTGSAAELAVQHKMGLEYGVRTLNASGGVEGKQIQLDIEDDQNDPKNTVAAVNKLITVDNVDVIISVTSSPSLAIAPILQKSGIPLIANCGDPLITSQFNNVFRNFPGTNLEVKRIAIFMSSGLKKKTAWLLYIDDAFGKGAERLVQQEFPKYGITLLGSDSYPKTSSDVKAIALKAINSNADVVYVYGYGVATAELVNRLRELGFTGILFGSLNFAQPPLTTIAKDAIKGSYYTIPAFENVGVTMAKDFWEGFQRQFNMPPPWNAAVEYDAVMLIAKASQMTSGKNTTLMTSLSMIGDYNGTAGIYVYQPSKDWELPMSIAHITEKGIEYAN